MDNAFTNLVGISRPVVAFSHSPAVVAAASQAGALGVLGAQRFDAEELGVALDWIDANCDKPYGVDVLYPIKDAGQEGGDLEARIPAEHREFVEQLGKRFDIPPLSEVGEDRDLMAAKQEFSGNIVTRDGVLELVELALEHPIRVLVSALGPLPAETCETARSKGVAVGGLVNTARHARRHVEAGADMVVAQGSEAAGHTGELSTLVTVPEIVNEIAPVPVVAAGGITTSRHVAGAFALGAQGIWAGSVWLPTVESDLDPKVKEALLSAGSGDTLRSRTTTGKPVRVLRRPWNDAWKEPGAPEPLPAPLQGMLVHDQLAAAFEHQIAAVMTTAAGQGVGLIREQLTVEQTLHRLLDDAADHAERAVELLR